MKRFFSIFLAVVLVVGCLCGCKEKGKNDVHSHENEYLESGMSESGEQSEIDVTVKTPSDESSSSSGSQSDASQSITATCKHAVFTTTVKQVRDCENDGVEVNVCSECSRMWESVTPKKGHTVVIQPAVPPTYSSTGLTEGSYCSDCGKVLSKQKTVSKLNKYDTPELPA